MAIKRIKNFCVMAVILGLWFGTGASAATDGGEFTVATLNVDGLPTSIWIIPSNPDGPGEEGTKIVSQYLAKKGYDIIGVQEDFNYDSELRSALEEDYDYGLWQGGLDASGVNWLALWKTKFDTDGLRVFWRKKHQLESEEAVAWTVSNGKFDHCWDDMVTKGFRRCEMTLDSGLRLVVYDMHLDASTDSDEQSGNDVGDRAARRRQWYQLRDSVMARLDERPVIVMGDMNSLYPRDSIQAIFIDPINATGRYYVSDTWVEFEQGGVYPEVGSGDRHVAYGNGEVLDKILYINPLDGQRLKLEDFRIEYDYVWDDGTPMGDHFPVSARFSTVGNGDTAIRRVGEDRQPQKVYTLSGQQLSGVPSRPGIYIINGRKCHIK